MDLKPLLFLAIGLICIEVKASDLPSKYTDLLDYVQQAPDQGESNTCLYVSSTGAMEILANRKAKIKNPEPYGTYDLSESFLIHAPTGESRGRSMWEIPLLKFNKTGYGIHITDWPYEAWDGTRPNGTVWNYRNWSRFEKVTLPKIEIQRLFIFGNKWSTNVLKPAHVTAIKEALWKYKSPVLINYNDNFYWHVILIVGYDDDLPGTCYDIPKADCEKDIGSFYVRDSFGVRAEIRDYDWFRVKGNAAFVVREAL